MRTFVAYLSAIVSMPITGTLVGLALSPMWAIAKRMDAWIAYRLAALIGTTASSIAMVFVADLIFRGIGVRFGMMAVAVMLTFLTFHNVGRLAKFRGTDGFSLEVAYTLGGFVGMSTGAAVLVWQQPAMVILIVLAVPSMIFLVLLRVSRGKSFPFWNLVSKIPDDAYQWFLKEEAWDVVDPVRANNGPPEPSQAYSGPYLLSVPCLGNRNIRVYGRNDSIEDSQRRFLEDHGS